MPIFQTACDSISGITISLDDGDARSGWIHIKNGKEKSFEAQGLSTDEKVQESIQETAAHPLFVYENVGRNCFELYDRHGSWIIKVIANRDTGRIVTAMPISESDGDMELQVAALAKVIASVPKTDNIGIRLKFAALQHLMMDFLKIAK
jgi:hypothetical protein